MPKKSKNAENSEEKDEKVQSMEKYLGLSCRAEVSEMARRKAGPQFLGVGPEKTGSTWLFQNLRAHPDVFLPPYKEIRYFYERSVYPDLTWYSRLSKKNWFTRQTRRYLIDRVREIKRSPYLALLDAGRLKWDVRYLFAKRTDEWYISLFDGANEQISGEISPQYFFMREDSIAYIRRMFPDLKIIVFLRDPIGWTWSFAQMLKVKGRRFDQVDDRELTAFFDAKMKHGFVKSIDRWQAEFGNNVYVDFYDRLDEEPHALYTDICAFLSIDVNRTPKDVWDCLARPVNKGKRVLLPNYYLQYLAEGWYGEIEHLCTRYSVYPQRWQERCSLILRNTTPRRAKV